MLKQHYWLPVFIFVAGLVGLYLILKFAPQVFGTMLLVGIPVAFFWLIYQSLKRT